MRPCGTGGAAMIRTVAKARASVIIRAFEKFARCYSMQEVPLQYHLFVAPSTASRLQTHRDDKLLIFS